MMPNILKNKLSMSILVSIIIAFIIAIFMTTGFFDTYESMISDSFYSPKNTLNDIVVVAIDDYSFENLGMYSTWTREYFSKVINNLNKSALIGIDIIFDLETNPENDLKLADSLNSSNVVLAIMYGDDFTFNNGELYGNSLIKPNEKLGTVGEDFDIGFINLYTDQDGVTRSFNPKISGIENHDHFSLVIANKYTYGYVPDLDSSRMLINYYAEPGGYEYISFYDVYNSEIPPQYFKDKIVLIGVTSPLEHDDYIVPISSQSMPGVEIHANIVQSIITQDFIYYQDDISAIGLIFLFALIVGFLLYKFKIHIATILIAVFTIVYVFFSLYIVDILGTILNLLYPILTISFIYTALIVVYYRTEIKDRKWITSIFGKYVSPVVIENLIKNPDKINLGGEKRNITIFFSDIRGFTPISEKLKPEELVHLLNEYLTEMTSIILKNQGVIDKYMGDAIMAFWGAPLDQPDHAARACSCSLEMMDRIKELQKKWKKEGIPSFDIGIGLNSGDAIVGNMGSDSRFDYTVMGDTVNLASRLEGLNKTYNTNIIVSENTYKIVKNEFDTKKLDTVKVKGKEKSVVIYELLSPKSKK
jgi:adenylate cyclase